MNSYVRNDNVFAFRGSNVQSQTYFNMHPKYKALKNSSEKSIFYFSTLRRRIAKLLAYFTARLH